MRLRARLIRLALLVAAVSLAVPLWWIATYRAPTLPAGARAIVVLAAGRDGERLGPETRARVDRGVQLWKAHAAPILMLTGAIKDDRGRSLSGKMVSRAVAEGVDPHAIRLDPDAQSTLQNALFTRRVLAPVLRGDLAAPVILVTHRYHLPRAWAAFRWAGFTNLTLVAADARRPLISPRDLAWEVVKWPVNILRGGIAAAMRAAGAPAQDYIWFLR